MRISKAKNGSLNLPFYMHLFFRYVLSNSCVSETLQDTGDATLFGSKEKDRSNAPLSFLELYLINNNKDDDKDDDIIKTINLRGVNYVLPGTALYLIHQALDKCLLNKYVYNLQCNARLLCMCPK